MSCPAQTGLETQRHLVILVSHKGPCAMWRCVCGGNQVIFLSEVGMDENTVTSEALVDEGECVLVMEVDREYNPHLPRGSRRGCRDTKYKRAPVVVCFLALINSEPQRLRDSLTDLLNCFFLITGKRTPHYFYSRYGIF